MPVDIAQEGLGVSITKWESRQWAYRDAVMLRCPIWCIVWSWVC